jgi:hypothetical protein|tara:strand:+ start:103 stop:474 length:372 start_codon:yes stop_codon:yes gene_type:complete
MSVIGEKQADIDGKITSVTVRKDWSEVNVEAQVGSFGMVYGTVTFEPAVDEAKETGPVVVQGRALRGDGSVVPFSGGGTWRKSGKYRREIKHISIDANGDRIFVVDEFDFEGRINSGVVYALD